MTKILCYWLALIIVSHAFSGLGVLAWFKVNQVYIAANLCENRDRPEKGCNGNCVLEKNLRIADAKPQDEQLPSSPTSAKSSDRLPLFFVLGLWNQSFFKPLVSFSCKRYDYLKSDLLTGFLFPVLRPPQL